MKSRTPLDEFVDQLAKKGQASTASVLIPRHTHTPEDKLPPDKHLECDRKCDDGVTFPETRDPVLAEAYLAYWRMLETSPLEVFQVMYQEIIRLEVAADPETAWRTLREAATAYHLETGVCPFCRERGPLHLLAEQVEMEFRDGR